MASRTIENYLKQLWLEEQAAAGCAPGEGNRLVRGRPCVSMGRLAQTVGVTPGTTTTMVKAMADAGLARYTPRAGVRLTRAGEQLALHVLRRHRLLELFLVEVLGIDWAAAHNEAEELEHAVSDMVLAHMDRLLGHPSVDPHGDPIPTACGSVHMPDVSSLSDIKPGGRTTIVRILDQSPEFLDFARNCGLVPRAQVTVEKVSGQSQAMSVRPGSLPEVSISVAVAGKFQVVPCRAGRHRAKRGRPAAALRTAGPGQGRA